MGGLTRLGGVSHDGRVRLSLLDLPVRRDRLLELIPESLRQQAIDATR
jgi:hypothetical protein